MAESTISQLEACGFTHIECSCGACRRSVWMPFALIRARRPRLMLAAMTIAELGQRMVCGECGARLAGSRPVRQSDASGFSSGFSYPRGAGQ